MENKLANLQSEDIILTEYIKNLIYTIRGKQVMLDSDVAKLYHYTTKRILEEGSTKNICHMHLQNKVLQCFQDY